MNEDVKRAPVNFRWDALNWEFLKLLAEVGFYGAAKYGATEQYTNARLEKDRSPVNHCYEHLRQYIAREEYEHFDGDIKYHLAAIAYNAMVEFFYLEHGGPTVTDAFVGGSKLDKKHALDGAEQMGFDFVSEDDKIMQQAVKMAVDSGFDFVTDVCGDEEKVARPFPTYDPLYPERPSLSEQGMQAARAFQIAGMQNDLSRHYDLSEDPVRVSSQDLKQDDETSPKSILSRFLNFGRAGKSAA